LILTLTEFYSFFFFRTSGNFSLCVPAQSDDDEQSDGGGSESASAFGEVVPQESEREQFNVSISSEAENPRARKRVRSNTKDELSQELVKFMKARAEPVQRDEDEPFQL
jgi:hypothetical protein